MGWTVLDLECRDVDTRERLLAWFEGRHDLERNEDGENAIGSLDLRELWRDADPDEPEVRAEVAWIGPYLYVTVLTNRTDREDGSVLDAVREATVSYWTRAVQATVDAHAQAVRSATLYAVSDGEPVERATYEGARGMGGVDLLYVFAMAHRFRFRAYGIRPPGRMRVTYPGAVDTPRETDPTSETVQELAEMTGVRPTIRGTAFVNRDPMLPEEVRTPDYGLRQWLGTALDVWLVRPIWLRVLRPLRARGQ